MDNHLYSKAHEIRMLTMLILKVTRQHIEQRFAQEGIELTMLQHGIMRMIQNQNLTLTDISKRMGLDPSTLVPIVDSLVKKGYIKRERDPADRRRYPLRLTAEGLNLHEVSCQHLENDPINSGLENFETDEVEQLRLLLRKLLQALPEGDSALAEIEETFHRQAPE